LACKKHEILRNIDTKRLIFETGDGEKVYRVNDSLVVKLPKNRNTLITSWINGGYKENLEAVFNNQLSQENINALENSSVSDFMFKKAHNLGLNPENVAGLLTSADIDNVAVSIRHFRELEVTAIVTGGVKVNGGTAGDPASYYEKNGTFEVGTINTIVLVNAALGEGTLTKAMMTAVEAKTVALQQLMVPSKYSTNIATGTGTDGISVISNMESENKLTNAGKHSKLGELIGTSVIEATKEALAKEVVITPESQCDMLVRMDRFGVTEESYWKAAENLGINDKNQFMQNLKELSGDPVIVAMTSAVLHVVDEVNWGLISESAGKMAAATIMKTFSESYGQNCYKVRFKEEDSIIGNWVKICVMHMKYQKFEEINIH
jgi:adenosylcobinamide hydrolase